MNKDAELSLNMIIVAVIGLIVLVVIVAVFAGKFTGWREGADATEKSFTGECELPGTNNVCVAASSLCISGNPKSGQFTCSKSGGTATVCCNK